MWEAKLGFSNLERQHGLPPGTLRAVMQAESAGNPRAVSPKGAKGLFQFMPATAQEYGIDPLIPEQAAPAAAKMLGGLYKQYGGDVNKMLAGYNWGSGNLQRKGLAKAPAETRNYINKITSQLGSQNISIDGPKNTGTFALIEDDLTPEEEAELERLERKFRNEMPQVQPFEDDLTPEEEAELARLEAKFGQPQPSQLPKKYNPIEAGAMGIAEGVTFNSFDELLSAAQSVPSWMDGVEGNSTYSDNLSRNRATLAQASDERPMSYAAGNIGGSIAPFVIGGGALAGTKLATKAAQLARTAPVRTAATTGAVQGSVYGFGGGEGSAGERLHQAGLGGGAGAVLGGSLGYVSSKVGTSLARKASQKELQSLEAQLAQRRGAETNVDDAALQKIIGRLRADYPDDADFKQALLTYARENKTLGQIGTRTENLAKGSVQFPSGRAVAEEFFVGKPEYPGGAKVGGAVERATDDLSASVASDVRGGKDYYEGLDELITKGREKASPLYSGAYKANKSVMTPEISKILDTPAGKGALKEAVTIMQNDRTLAALPDKELTEIARDLSSMGKMAEQTGVVASGLKLRTLDYVKRALDRKIRRSVVAGEGVPGELEGLRSSLVRELDTADITAKNGQPGMYAQGRKAAGDYKSHQEAMEYGRKFAQWNAKETTRALRNASETEKEAFRLGVGQSLDDTINKTADSGNTVSKIFGSKEARNRLKQILTPEQYNRFQVKARAVDQLVAFRKNTIGGSATMPNAMAASAPEFADEAAELVTNVITKGPKAAGVGKVAEYLKARAKGINDKNAGKIAEALFEDDPQKKLAIVRKIANQTGAIVTKEQKQALQVFYSVQDAIRSKSAPAIGAASGNVGAELSTPTRVTVYRQGGPRNESNVK